MSRQKKKTKNIHQHIIRIQAEVLAFVMAIFCGLAIFIATAWLVIKGGPHMGRHLILLRQYFPGYTVTWGGSFLGLIYGLIIGGILGLAIGLIYNLIVDLKER
jgi:uncharacterized membrane protein